jgi:hypothetical protein
VDKKLKLLLGYIHMEIAEQIIRRFKNSAYLGKQTDTLNKICNDLLWEVDNGCHLTSFQRSVVRSAGQILRDLADDHSRAMREVLAYEAEASLAPERAKSIMAAKVSTLSVAGKVALVAFENEDFQRRGQLSAIDAKELLGEHFDLCIKYMTDRAVSVSRYEHLAIDMAVEKLWDEFEDRRQFIEGKLAGRIRVYEKQVALALKQSQAAS